MPSGNKWKRAKTCS